MSKGRHRKATRVEKTVAKVAIVGVGATAIPLTFMGGSAQAASIDQWDQIAQCESGGDWSINHSSDGLSVGGIQFQNPSWQDALRELERRGYDTSGYPQTLYQGMPRDEVPTKKQQILAGEAYLALPYAGPSAWVCNAIAGYPLSSSGPNASMFDGGVNPYPTNLDTKPEPKPEPEPKEEDAKPEVNEDKPAAPKESSGESSASTYTIVKGDTLYDISITNGIGDGGLDTWKPLYEANKDVVGSNPDLIFPGQVLTLPDGTVNKKSEVSEESVEYTVRKGDTLWSLAEYYYGDGHDFTKIFEANRPPLHSDPSALEIGTKLTIPGTSKSAPPAAKPAPSTPAPAPKANGVSLPLASSVVSQSYGNYSAGYTLGYHTGTDFRASAGTPVLAVADGTVVKSDTSPAYGINVQIQHDDGTYSLYAHLSERTVQPGDRVEAGRMIGNVGNTGTSTGAHLHLEIRTAPTFAAGNFLDAVEWLRDKGLSI